MGAAVQVVSKIKQFEMQIQFFLILVYGMLIAYPIIRTPLGTDDIWMSIVHSYNGFHGIGFFDSYRNSIEALANIGRMNTLGVLIQFLTSFLMENRFYYKLFLIAINLILGFRIRKLLQLFFPKSMHIPNLSLMIFFSFGQIRSYYDPRTQISGVLHIALILMIGAVICWYKYKIEKRVLLLVLFSFYSILAFYVYDLSFFIFFPFLFVVSIQSIKIFSNFVQTSTGEKISYLIIWAQYLVMLYVRYSAPALQEDAKLNFSSDLFFNTLKIQLLGSFPTTLFESKNVSGFSSNPIVLLFGFAILSIMLALTLIISFKNHVSHRLILPRSDFPARIQILPILIFGISLIFVPAIITAIAPRYQIEVKNGLPYFGFMAQQVGVVISIFLVFLLANGMRKILIFKSLCLIFAWFGLISFSSNQFLTHPSNQTESNLTLSQRTIGWDREIIESGVRNGVLKRFEKNSVFSFIPQYSWTTSENLTDINNEIVLIEGSPTWWNNTDNKVKNVCLSGSCSQYVVYPVAVNYREGFLVIGRIDGSAKEVEKLATNDWSLYVETNSNSLAQMALVPCFVSDSGKKIDILSSSGLDLTEKSGFFQLKLSKDKSLASTRFVLCSR
jgi:hypothetical protein